LPSCWLHVSAVHKHSTDSFERPAAMRKVGSCCYGVTTVHCCTSSGAAAAVATVGRMKYESQSSPRAHADCNTRKKSRMMRRRRSSREKIRGEREKAPSRNAR
jgi:hypothetical protein